MDRGAWQAMVHRVAQSQIQQKQLSTCVHAYPLLHKPPPHPILPFYIITECQAGLLVLYSNFLLAVLHMVVYICQCYFLIHPTF